MPSQKSSPVSVVRCGAVAAECVCSIPDGRCDGRHLCRCGGSWKNKANAQEDILILPTGGTWAETVEASDLMIRYFASTLPGQAS